MVLVQAVLFCAAAIRVVHQGFFHRLQLDCCPLAKNVPELLQSRLMLLAQLALDQLRVQAALLGGVGCGIFEANAARLYCAKSEPAA